MTHLPPILTFVGFYLPGYKAGGPIQSVANLVEHLGAQFNFRIVTRDRDAGDATPYPAIAHSCWQAVGNAQVCYMRPAVQMPLITASLMRRTPHDLLYLNSFFDWRSSVLPLLVRHMGLAPRKPVVLAPRGEFSQGALALKSGKKRAFLSASKTMGLHREILWHASSKHEAEDIRAIFGSSQEIHIASDLPRTVQAGLSHEPRPPAAPLRIVFLSRISPKKNLTFALEVLRNVKVPVNFSIIGPIGDLTYWKECEARIAELPTHIKATYDGIVAAEQVPKVMAQNDMFFLPTLGENFGHVIIEALGAGTPALISDQTPWRDFDAEGCGWVLPLREARAFADRIHAAFRESPADNAKRRSAALRFARRFGSDSSVVDDNRNLFLRAVAKRAG